MNSIADLIELPQVKTVIKFSDLEDEVSRKLIQGNFILTGEVTENLSIVLREIVRKKGQGFFLQGNYGTGKSHFLSILYIILTDPLSHSIFPPSSELSHISVNLLSEKLFVLNISLLDYSSSESLEDIICSSLDKRLKTLTGKGILVDFHRYREDIISLLTNRYKVQFEIFLEEKGIKEEELFSSEGPFSLLEELLSNLDLPYRFKYSRKDFFEEFSKVLTGYSGTVLLLDELSEYLRSKTTGRKFNEDIRFLQFLGEISSALPLWIVAGLQERIEETGEISPYVFNKIKDRYPVRLLLSGKHIEELIKGRLIIKKVNAEEKLKALYNKFKSAFSSWPVSKERFISLYPVHPETVFLLDNLKFLFSQHRGVVDFIHYQLKGDDTRNIKGILSEPEDTLLSPEKIFDHFRMRIKETLEINPYYDIVYRFYEQEMEKFFPGAEERLIAFKLIKILILISILPIKKNYTVRNLAECLLYRLTSIESGINYQYFNDILEKLYKEGSYIGVSESSEKFGTAYFIDLESDINLIIKRKTEYIEKTLFPEDSRIYENLLPWFTDPVFPLAHIRIHTLNRRNITWQNTLREVGIVLTNLIRLTNEKISLLEEQSSRNEMDLILFIATPGVIDTQKKYLEENLIPLLEKKNRESFIFWFPDKIMDESSLRIALSHTILWEKYSQDSSKTADRAKEVLSTLLNKDRKRITSILMEAYKGGKFIFLREELKYSLKNDFFSFDKIIEDISFSILEYKYPKHIEISPFTPVLTRNKIKDLIERFLKSGRLIADRGTDYGLRMIVEGFLRPMKLIKKLSGGFELSVSPRKSEIVELFLSLMEEERNSLEDIYWKMRKGPWGISQLQFELLTYSLIFSGLITPFNENRKISLNQISGNNFDKITHISPGELIPSSLQDAIRKLPFIPQKFQKEDFNYSSQQEIWGILCEKKRELLEDLQKVTDEINRVSTYQGLSEFPWEKIWQDISVIKETLEEIKTSYTSAEGLERLSLHLKKEPYFTEIYERVCHINKFFLEYLDRYLFIYHYINYPDFVIPSENRYILIMEQKKLVENFLRDKYRIFSADYIKELDEVFHRFFILYQATYEKEHNTILSEDRFRLFDSIRDTEGYKWLKSLSKISFISVKNDRIKADRFLARAVEKRCTYFEPGLLRRKPLCTCGFKLGSELNLPSVQDAEDIITKGIKEYLISLREERYRENLYYSIRSLEEIGEKKMASSLKQLLQLDMEDTSLISDLRQYLTQEIIEIINESLAGRIILITRDIDELYDNLVDRSFPKDKFIDIFQEWLEGGQKLDSRVYIKVISTSHPDKEGPLKMEIEEKYPEILTFYQRWGEEHFNLLLWTLKWFHNYSIEYFPYIYSLAGIEPENIQKEYDSIIEFADYISSRKKDQKALLIKEAESLIIERKQEGEFWKILENNSQDRILMLLNIIRKENIFPFIIEKAFYLFFKMIQDRPALVNREEIINFYNSPHIDIELIGKEESRVFKIFFSLYKAMDSLNKWPKDKINGYLEWEKVFCFYMAFIPYWLCSLHKRSQITTLIEEITLKQLKENTKKVLREYNEKFLEFYQRKYPEWKNGEKPRPYFAQDIMTEIHSTYSNTLKPQKVEFLLMDCMRWDLWWYIKKKISLYEWRIVKEIPLWSHPPTITHVQLEAIYSSTWPNCARLEKFSLETYEENLPLEERENISSAENLIKYNLIDKKVHTSIEDIETLYQEIVLQLAPYLQVYLDSLPQKTMIIIFSDHGFCEREKGGYFHGSVSLWEVIVPMIIMFKS